MGIRQIVISSLLVTQMAFMLCAAGQGRPNIILFVADDQSLFDYGFYGNDSVPTKAIDAFAKESLVFESAYTGQAICAPSRSMLYTGLYPIRNGCFINHTSIRPEVKTLPSYLKAVGYDVVLAGKSHVNPTESFPWTDWFRPEKSEGKPRPDLAFNKMNGFFENTSKPFCMVVASEYPHGPFFEKTPFDPEDVELEPFRAKTIQERKVNARYYANIQEGNGEFARLLSMLDKNKLSANTILIYTSDHGMFRGKFTVYGSGLRVPFMVRWPGKINPGRTGALVSFADVLPTLLDIAGGDIPRDLDGKSMLPIWLETTDKGQDFVYGVGESQGIQDRSLFPQRSVNDGRYNYIYSFNSLERLQRDQKKGVKPDYFRERDARRFSGRAEEELYDTLNDPYEMNNIADKKEIALIKNNLRRELFSWMKRQGDYLKPDGKLPYFVPKMHWMDEPNKNFNYSVPEKFIGSLKGNYVSAHDLTALK